MAHQWSIEIHAKEIHDPAWKDKVERWYQLDEASRVLCEAFSRFLKTPQDLEAILACESIIYAFSSGSNWADLDFVQSGAESPSKFVYTLPNIPIQVLQQMLAMQKPTYCVYLGDIRPEEKLKTLQLSLMHNGKRVLVITLQPAKNTIKDCWTIEAEIKS